MANIYSNAYITLAATGPAGNGCFFERWTNPSILNWGLKVPVHSHQLSSLRNPNLKLYARIRLDGTFNSFTAGVTIGILEDSAPLLSRAWVFQERFLSPRVLYFHPSSLVWECRSALYLEPYSLEDFSTQRTESDVPMRLKKLFAKLDSPSTTLVAEVHDLWLSFVDEYSRLRLTYETDRLPALSGVATRFQEFMSAKGFTDDEYLAGIWRSDLVRSLAWGRSEGVTRRFPKPCPPSWSWASVDRVSGNSMITFRHDHIYYGESSRERGFVPDARLRVLDVSCELVGKSTFGHVSGGRLKLVAATVDAIIFYKQQPTHATSFPDSKTAPLKVVLLFQSNVDEDWVLVETEGIWKDVLLYVEGGVEFLSPGTVVKCLLVGRANDFSGVVNLAIVLKEAGEDNFGCYERIGLLVCEVEKLRAILDMRETESSIV